jgi:murein L,D-transpeptidase YcbB/YkuD
MLSLLLIALLAAPVPTLHVSPDSSVAAAARRILAAGQNPAMRWPRLTDVRGSAESLYAAAAPRPLWVRDGRATPAARAFVGVLREAETRGLDPRDYDGARLDSLSAALGPESSVAELATFDAMLTVAALRFVSALDRGRIDPRVVHANFHVPNEAYDLLGAIAALTSAGGPDSIIAAAEPQFHHYWLLKRALAKYRGLARDSGLLPLPPFPRRLKPGGSYVGAAQLRRLLMALGDIVDSIAPVAKDDSVYSDDLVQGVRHFQARQGFAVDGVIGGSTAASLSRSFPQRIRQIELTLERWRWMPRQFSAPPIIVNVPAFRLHAFGTMDDFEASLLSMNVVVGQAFKTETPVFAADMTYLVFSPYWDVPVTIMRKEIRPEAQAKAGWLARNHMQLLRGGTVVRATPENIAAIGAGVRVRQTPGPWNSLGLVKFMLPNEHAIYLHDTPSKSLFEVPRRDYSHGCIRVADAVALAQFVLRDQPAWTPERIASAMGAEAPQTVTLSRAIPVFVVYGTAVARENGEVFFYADIYGHDRTLDRLLQKGYPYPR